MKLHTFSLRTIAVITTFLWSAFSLAQYTGQKSNFLNHAKDSTGLYAPEDTTVEMRIGADGDTTYVFSLNPVNAINGNVGNVAGLSEPEVQTGSAKIMPSCRTPSADRCVGKIPFTESVSPTGARIYTIPIATANDCPLKPEVSIVYNSQTGNGVVGYGWSLVAASSITVVNRTFYYDGKAEAPDLTKPADCAFALDGVRLVGYAGTLSQYQYETAQGFILVQKQMSGENVAYFTVAYPNGSKATFGFRNNTQMQTAYPITELVDIKGNRADFSYVRSGNCYYISSIAYGGKSADCHTAEIRFAYADRTDFVTTYMASTPLSANRLLKGIVSCNTADGKMQELCTYAFTHTLDDVNRLTQIDCRSADSSLEPLRFQYDAERNPGADRFRESGNSFIERYFSSKASPVYVRGKFVRNQYADGLVTFPGCFSPYTQVGYDSGREPVLGSGYPSDQNILIVPRCDFYNATDSIKAEVGFQTIQATDVDGDGVDEIVKVNFAGVSGSNTVLKITEYSYNGKGFSPKSFTVSVFGTVENKKKTKSPMSREYLFGDFMGNGKVQLLTVTHDTDVFGKSRESRFALIDIDGKNKLFDGTLFPFGIGDARYTWVADVDGDGKAELCHASGSSVDVYACVDNVFKKIFAAADIYRSKCENSILGDINGDGKMDFITPPGMSFLDEEVLYVPVWAPEKCIYCGKDNPIRRDDATSCKFCERDLLNYYIVRTEQGMVQCRACSTTLLVADYALAPMSKVPSCPQHGFTCSVNRSEYVDRGSKWTVFVSTGNGFSRKEMDITRRERSDEFVLMDVNRDGLADLVCLRNGTLRLYANKWGKMSQRVVSSQSAAYGSHLLPANVCNLYGMSDLTTVSDAVITGYTYLRQCSRENLLTSMTDSYGNCHVNEYSDMADSESDCYRAFGNYTYPYVCMTVPLNLLTSTAVYIGNNSIRFGNTAFRYADAVFHRLGLGFLGFHTMETENQEAGTVSSETRDMEMFGIVTQTDTPEKNTRIAYVCNTNGGRMNPQPVSIVEEDKLTGVAVETNVSYDIYNNPIEKTVSYGASQKNLQTMSYENVITPSCYLTGLPTSVVVKSIRAGQTWTTKTVTAYNDAHQPSSRISYTEGKKTGETRWTYDVNGNVTSELSAPYDVANFVGTTYTYDKDGRHVLSATNALGQKTVYSDYDKYGCACTVTDFMGGVTRHTVNAWGDVLSTEYPDGTEECVSASWGGVGLYTITNTLTGQPATVVHYDALGREVRSGSLRPDGKWQMADKKYDGRGRLSMSSLPFVGASPVYWNTYMYDLHNRLIHQLDASGKETVFSYDGLSTTETRDGIVSTKTFDAVGHLVKSEDAGGAIVYVLRPDGQPSTIMAPGGIVTSFSYDGYGRRTAIDDPSFGRQTFSEKFAPDGMCVQTVTDADGRTVATTIDRYGRKVKEVRPEGTAVWRYDTRGNLVESSSANSIVTRYSYDKLGRISEKTLLLEDKTFSKKYAYSDGNVVAKSMTLHSGSSQPVTVKETYEYSNGTLVKTLFNDAVIISGLLEQNALGQATRVITGSIIREYGFDDYGTPVSRRAGTIQHQSYVFDRQTGNLFSRTDEMRNLTETFRYDALNRLTQMDGKAVVYADNGNILKIEDTGEMDYQDRLRPYAITGLCRTVPDGRYIGQTVAYNSFHRPSTITQGSHSLSFVYDASGNRVKMSGDILCYYLDECEIRETDRKKIIYLGGDAYTAPMAYVCGKADDDLRLVNICRDYLGSVTHIADLNGALIEEYSYDAWGRMRNPATHKVYPMSIYPKLYLGRGYTGHEHIQPYRLINMNARLYDPEIGRFLSPDPYVQQPDFTQNFNRYSYCVNNPLKYNDQSGEWFLIDDLVVGGISFVIGYVGHGLSTGNWGLSAVKSGICNAFSSWIVFNTAGIAMGTPNNMWNYALNMGANALLSQVVPSLNIPIGDFNVSFSPIAAMSESGFTYGVSASAFYSAGGFCFSGGFGVTNKYCGWEMGILKEKSSVGVGYGRTYYGADVVGGQYLGKQTVGTVSLQFGRNVSFRISNDLWGDKEDRWRTSAAELTVRGISVGTFVTTNNGSNASGYKKDGDLDSDLASMLQEPKDGIIGYNKYKYYKEKDEDGNEKSRAKGGTWKNGEIYRAPLWIGVRSGRQITRFGVSSKHVQSLTQNVVHKYLSKTAFFMGTSHFTRGLYSYFGTYSAYSIF